MEAGSAWYRGEDRHTVYNRGTVDRVHLVIDASSMSGSGRADDAAGAVVQRPPVDLLRSLAD